MTNSILPATVLLPTRAYQAIVAHARAGKPEEICGILRGRGLVAFESIRGRNIASERIENYDIDPQTLLLQFQFEKTGDEMMGIYHSHPVSVAYPSATDAWNAHYPDAIYFICSLQEDDAPVLRAFRMTPHFLELDLKLLQAILPFYETRPHLFAYQQPVDAPIPPALQTVTEIMAGQVARPFYIVYYAEGEIESRVVTITEYPIELVETI